MKQLILFLIPIIFLISCNSKDEKINNGKPVTNTESPARNELKIIEQNGKSFYDWYFKNDFPNCDIIKDKNGKCLMDTVSYFKTLRNLGTVSEKFIRQEKKRLQTCAEFMSALDYSEFESADAYEYDEYCPEIYYMYWIHSQEPPISFSAKNIRKTSNSKASLDIYVNYGVNDEALSNITLEKENNIWKITAIKFINREETPVKKANISGKWQGGIAVLNIDTHSLAFEYHGQCVYFYPIKKINENEFEMIWARDMDCKFDNGTGKDFGLKNAPEIGKPFAKYKLKDNILYAEYYYKEWVKKYTEQVQKDVFTDKYFRKNEHN